MQEVDLKARREVFQCLWLLKGPGLLDREEASSQYGPSSSKELNAGDFFWRCQLELFFFTRA